MFSSLEPTPDGTPHSTLWQNRDFRLLWVGHTISMLGSQITAVAMPLIAALTLHATPAQMAFLLSLGYAPATLISLFAGVLIDRVRRRPVMILVDLLSVVLLLLIPVLALRGWLNMAALYGVSFLLSVAGASTMCLGLAAALLGTALGGVLGEHVGIPATIVIGAIGGTFSFVWLVFSPIRQLHDLDDVS